MTRDPEAVSKVKLSGRVYRAEFDLAQGADVELRIASLKGLNKGDDTRAGASLDDEWLGYFTRRDNGKAWSSRRLRLAKGKHVLEVQAGREGEEDLDDFVLRGLEVWAPGPGAPRPRLNVALAEAAKPPQPPCPGLEFLDARQLLPHPRVISVTSGREADSGLKLTLKPMQAWVWSMKIGRLEWKGRFVDPPLLLSWSMEAADRAKVVLHLDPRELARLRPGGDAWHAKDYQGGEYNEAMLWSCAPGQAFFRFADNPPIPFEFKGPALTVDLGVRGVEISLKAP